MSPLAGVPLSLSLLSHRVKRIHKYNGDPTATVGFTKVTV